MVEWPVGDAVLGDGVFGLVVWVVAHGYESLGSGWIEVAFARSSLGTV